MLLSHLSLRTRLDCGVALNMQIPLKETTANPVHSKELPLSHLPCSLSSHPPLSLCAKHCTSVRGRSAGAPFSACLLSYGLCASSVNPNNMGKEDGPVGKLKRLAKWQRGEQLYFMQTRCQLLGKCSGKFRVVCPSSDADQFPCIRKHLQIDMFYNGMFVKEKLSGQTSP